MDISNEILIQMYSTMLKIRRFEEKVEELATTGRIGGFAHLYIGQEAVSTGAANAMNIGQDSVITAYRDHGIALAMGMTADECMAELFGKIGGCSRGKGGSMHFFSAEKRLFGGHGIVGGHIPVGVGIAFAHKYKEDGGVCLCFFGDGATSEGDFHEALNFAGVFQTPVIFVCQNNQWAISLPRKKQTRSQTLAQKALAYGLPGIQVDGNDVLAVYAAAAEAVDRARKGEGATLIECVTYRMSVHTTADDPKRYRTEDEVEDWRKRDPLTRLQKYLIRKNRLSEEKIAAAENDVKEKIQAAVDRAEQQMKDFGAPSDMFNHAYAEMPSLLKEQKEFLERELAENREE